MDNPGVYAQHLQPDAWPFLAFFGVVAAVPLFLLGVLVIRGGGSKMAALCGGLVVAVSIVVLGAGIVGLTSARDAYAAAEDSNRESYRHNVRAWALSTYELDLSEDELSSLLNRETVLLTSVNPPQRAHLVIDRVNDQISIVTKRAPAPG